MILSHIHIQTNTYNRRKDEYSIQGYLWNNKYRNLRENKHAYMYWFWSVTKFCWALEWVPKHLVTPELCKIAVAQNGLALLSVPEHLRTPELCKLAVTENGQAILYVPDHLQQQIKQELGII